MPDTNQIPDELQISTLVARNLSSFKSLISALQDDRKHASRAASSLAKFKVWAGSIGAHRPSGGRSLEYRLRDASFIREHVVSLLIDLGASIDEGKLIAKEESLPHELNTSSEFDDTEWARYFQDDGVSKESETGQCLDAIGHVINCLLRLSVTIRNPAPHDQSSSSAGKDLIEFYEQWEMQHVRDKFPDAGNEAVQTLSKAMARRRQYFKYRKAHVDRLAEGLNDDGPVGGDATTIASSLPRQLKDQEAANEGRFMDDVRSDTSGTSYASSNPSSDQPRVPPLPKVKHVFRDLRPYVCLSSNCSAPEHLYTSRNEFARHMRQDHWKTWCCSFGCPETYYSAEDFRNHVRTSHGQDISPDKHITFERLSSQPDLEKACGECPLCSIVQIDSPEHYARHVGEHLEHLALFSLPKTEEGENERDMSSEESVYQDDSSPRYEDENEHNISREKSLRHGDLTRVEDLDEYDLVVPGTAVYAAKGDVDPETAPEYHNTSQPQKLDKRESPLVSPTPFGLTGWARLWDVLSWNRDTAPVPPNSSMPATPAMPEIPARSAKSAITPMTPMRSIPDADVESLRHGVGRLNLEQRARERKSQAKAKDAAPRSPLESKWKVTPMWTCHQCNFIWIRDTTPACIQCDHIPCILCNTSMEKVRT
ncbi:Fc.00g078380.m01.CDS01 [Cosmosporella sp. VM-42]